MGDDAHKKKLHAGLAQTVAHRDAITDAKRQLVRKTEDQLNSLLPVIKEWEAAVQAGRGGGVLAARRLRTLLDERQRLEAVLSKYGHLIEGAEG